MKKQYIMGINSAYHESSVTILCNGEIVAAVEEERFNRIKHAKEAKIDNACELPINAIEFCLKQANLKNLEEVEHIGYSFNPKNRLNKNVNYSVPYSIDESDFGTKKSEKIFYESNLRVEPKLRDMGFKGQFHYFDHHLCHAASSFFVSNYDESAVIVVDGIGEFESTTLYEGIDNHLEKLESFDFPNSLGLLWEKISFYLGFSIYDAAKAMGLSSYGDPSVFKDEIKNILTINEDGTFIVNDDIVQLRNFECAKLEALFRLTPRNKPVTEITPQTQGYADVAIALQVATEEIFINLAKRVKKQTNSKYLCLAGGVALNCVANGFLSRAKIFDNFYVQPAANDAGTSIGAAYLVWYHFLKNPRKKFFQTPYLGPEYDNRQIENVLKKNNLIYKHCEDIASKTAKLLTQGNIISWFQGRMELGPRALGNRSLLADPRHKETVELINVKIKHREPFRPFCPSVLLEEAKEWFELPQPLPEIASYMLGTFNVLPDKKDLIPAVVHFDGTCRIQTVDPKVNPRYHRLISQMQKLTGVPVVLNTSFNDREPIVCSPQDAVSTFLKTEIDYLAIGDFLVNKKEQILNKEGTSNA